MSFDTQCHLLFFRSCYFVFQSCLFNVFIHVGFKKQNKCFLMCLQWFPVNDPDKKNKDYSLSLALSVSLKYQSRLFLTSEPLKAFRSSYLKYL